MDSDSEKLLVFRPEEEFPLARRANTSCRCGSDYGPLPAVFVDEHSRSLECKTCGARIEAFDYMWRISTEGSSLIRNLKALVDDITLKKAQVAILEDEIKGLKSAKNSLKKGRLPSEPEPLPCRPEFARETHL